MSVVGMARASACALFIAVVIAGHTPAFATGDPVLFVDPLVGTAGNPNDGPSDTFPGADAPFGMVQWSPDTPSRPSGGGYAYSDADITGFSLTHLSGPGCDVFGDVSILPTIGDITKPSSERQSFRHTTEVATPGYYEVMVGEPAIRSQLTVTTRTGLGAFSFPATTQANILVNAASNQVGVADAAIRFVGQNEIDGWATSGWFCGMPGTYTVFFALRFDRPFSSHGTWSSSKVMAGQDAINGSGTGGWATFDTTVQPVVRVKAAISWVSIAGARANLDTEARTWDLDQERAAVAQAWRGELARIQVDGGTPQQLRTFYTALYHAMLHPNVYSDANGMYRGFDGFVHHADSGHTEYATFSGWDIYRTQIPLVAMVDPRRTSDMMRSLVHASQQMGWLPKWSLVNVESGVMGGDPADPIIAGAYAFGARDFDVHAALAAMMKGATQAEGGPGQGWYIERPGLGEYASRGYVVNDHATNVSPVANGASLTLEYAFDDFSIARMASAAGDNAIAHAMMSRAANWSTLFNTSTQLIAPRDRDGAFTFSPIARHGQDGFQEGNGVQYSWMVPHDMARLINGMGGNTSATAALDTFFLKLDAGPGEPYAWLGNEPTITSPWTYLFAQAPWKAQRVVRDAINQLWGDVPDGLPGNDDLGTMSAWYVWSALGLYPQNPAEPLLVIGTPLFQRAQIRVPGGANIQILAPAAAPNNAYIEALRRNGVPWTRSWIPYSPSARVRLDVDAGAAPNKAWAAKPSDMPPSYDVGFKSFPPSTSARLIADPQQLRLDPGASVVLHLQLSNLDAVNSVSARIAPLGLPSTFHLHGSDQPLTADAHRASLAELTLSADASTPPGLYNVALAGTTADGASLARATWVITVARAQASFPLAYVANYFDNTVVPVDPHTHAFGVPIPVGANPRDVSLSPDGTRLYVADQGDQAVSVIDVRAQRVIGTVTLAGSPWGVRVAPDGRTVWVSLTSDNAVQPIDVSTLVAGKTIAVGDEPGNIAISPNGAFLLVADLRSNDVTPVDLRTRTALAPIPTGAHPRSVAIAPDGASAYVTNSGADSVTVIDMIKFAAVGDVRVGVSPRGLAFAADGRSVYVANFASNTITTIDTATRTVRGSTFVGYNPIAVGVEPGGASALVVNSGDNDCVPVDLSTHAVGQRIPLGNRPIAIAR